MTASTGAMRFARDAGRCGPACPPALPAPLGRRELRLVTGMRQPIGVMAGRPESTASTLSTARSAIATLVSRVALPR